MFIAISCVAPVIVDKSLVRPFNVFFSIPHPQTQPQSHILSLQTNET